MAATDLTPQLMALMPDNLLHDGPDVDTSTLRARLNLLDRQYLVLNIARFLYDNEADLGDVAFEMTEDDCRVDIDNDEITVAGDAKNPQEIVAAVQALREELDASVDEDNAHLLNKILRDLNAVGWDMPQAWSVLERHAPTNGPTASQWLGEHRAAWQQEALEIDTPTSTPASTPKRRM